jgi:hypothetical protein
VPNPGGDNGQMFADTPQYGEVVQQQALAGAAPLSAPKPQPGPTPAAPMSMPAGPFALPTVPPMEGVAYYAALARKWRALARLPGASEQVKQMAANASTNYRNEKKHRAS